MRWTARSAWRPVWLGLAMTAIALTLALSPASVATPSWPHDFIVVLGWVGTVLFGFVTLFHIVNAIRLWRVTKAR